MLLAEILKEQAQPKPVEVSRRLTEALAASMPETRGEPVSADMPFRMSGLDSLCPRMYAIMLRDGIGPEVLDAENRWILGTGTAFHRQFQEDYLQTLGDVFQGWWRCKWCGAAHRGEPMRGHLSHGWIPRPKVCGYHIVGHGCRSTEFEYVELEFWIPEYRISGHCDGVLVWGPDDIELLELKTISDKGFQYIDPMLGGKPRSGHVIQAHGYFWGVEATPIKRTRVVYIKKSYEAMAQVLCEHVVEKRQEYIDSIKKLLTDTFEGLKAVEVYDGDDEPPIPDRLEECGKRSDNRTRFCPAKGPCFAKKKKAA